MWLEKNLQQQKNGGVMTVALQRLWRSIIEVGAASASLLGILLVQAILISMTVRNLFPEKLPRFSLSDSPLKTKMETQRLRLCNFVDGLRQRLAAMRR